MSRSDSSGGHRPWLIAHRGANAEAPENTVAAFDAAMGHGVDGLEFDVQITGDGVPVIFHDDTLKRMTGEKGSIPDYPHEAVAGFETGARYCGKWRADAIPDLEAVLAAYAGRAVLMIELKAVGRAGNAADRKNRLARRFVECIERRVDNTRRKNLFILSFDADILEAVRQRAPDLKLILNIKKPFAAPAPARDAKSRFYGYGVPLQRLSREFVRACHNAGQMVMTYSCNSETEIDRALAMEVDALLTDDPGRVGPYFNSVTRGLQSSGALTGKQGGRG